ncbi:MAG: formylglycine-generating enzyme family protein [Deltaproteobacteria bacterium]|nr:formylglycine-generating enzyme family protein [Deltaproteobacteria bacterium]
MAKERCSRNFITILSFLWALVLVLVMMLIPLLSFAGEAPPPSEAKPVPFSGTLDRDGKAVTETVRMVFSLFADESGGTSLWSEEQQVNVYSGAFQVLLGSTSAEKARELAALMGSHDSLFLEIAVGPMGNEVTLSGRQRFLGYVARWSLLGTLRDILDLGDLSDQDLARDLHNLLTNECPIGYSRSTDPADAAYVVCKRGNDEMVKAGDFWVDRYEMIVVDQGLYNQGKCNGTGTVYQRWWDQRVDMHKAGFVRNGSDTTIDLYACSTEKVDDAYTKPSRMITWFQALRACSNSGKHLCTNSEWQLAASGTPDGEHDCNLTDWKPKGNSGGPYDVGQFPNCVSKYGAYDMVGNLAEWVQGWFGQGQDSSVVIHQSVEFNGDAVVNVDPAEHLGNYPPDSNTPTPPTFPAAMLRGGFYSSGTGGGVFSVDMSHSPADWKQAFIGARCCRSR